MKLVSVIVPVYNMETLLPRCIESILAQSYSNIELILVNDGSRDESGNICDLYSQRDARIIAIHKENSGVADATNMGLDAMHGDFVVFVDSDDYIEPTMIEHLMNVQVAVNADIVQTGMARVNEHNVVTEVHSFEATTLVPTENIIREFFCGRNILLCLAAKLFVRRLFDTYRFESGRNIIDVLSMPELLQHSNIYAITDGAGYYAYFREGSVSRGFLTDKTYDDSKYYLQSWEDFLQRYYPANEEYMAMVYYRGAYEMSYKYPLLVKSPYVTGKKSKKKEMRQIFFEKYKKLLKTGYVFGVAKKRMFAFKLFAIHPVLFRIGLFCQRKKK